MNPQPPTRTNPLTGMDQFRRLLAFVRPYSGRLLLARVGMMVIPTLPGMVAIIQRASISAQGTQPK